MHEPCDLLTQHVDLSSIWLVQISNGKKHLFNRTFSDEAGASPNWLFVAPTNRTKNKKAIVKVACIPVGKNPVQVRTGGY